MNRRKKGKDNEIFNLCAFCGKPSDEKKCGKFFISKLHGFAVHQYCMFFSAALPQNGQDHEGFEGFLEEDVLKETRRASRLRCCFCLKKGASAGCCDLSCKKGFHFTCGLEQKYLFQFFGQFRAYCFDHRPSQKTKSYPSLKSPCPICLESVQCRASPDILTTPCCKDVWLHRSCVQEQALASGYFFRCAVCNDTEKFVKEMKRMGIYVPDRDAAWEDGNNFAELLEKYSRCDNTPCRCPMGKTFSADSGQWELVLCSSCGQYGTHIGCKSWGTNPPSLLCPTCRPVHECDDKITTRAAGPLTTNPEGAVTNSYVARKSKAPPRGKRRNTESDEDSDDISIVLNGLKRQAQDDVLNSDTSFFVQRAIAAGNAVIENSGSKKFKTSQSAIANSNPSIVDSARKRKAEDVSRKSSEESDDDILITKYVPGRRKCEICPKCNRRKPMNIERSPAIAPRKVFAAGSTSTLGKSSGSTCTITKADIERKEAGYESAGSGPTRRGKCDTVSAGVKVADYEVLELAAEHTNKSSVLLIPSEEKPSETEAMLEGNYTKITKNDLFLKDQNENNLQRTPSNVPKTHSFWLSSVERFFQFLNPRSGEEPQQESISEKDVREMPESTRQRSADPRRSLNDTRQVSVHSPNSDGSEVDSNISSGSGRKSGRPRRRANAIDGASNAAVRQWEEKVDLTLLPMNSEQISPENPVAIEQGSTTLGTESEITGAKLESCLNTSETNSKPAEEECNSSNSSIFSKSPTNSEDENIRSQNGDSDSTKDYEFLSKKAVLEAVIDRTIKNRCVSSC